MAIVPPFPLRLISTGVPSEILNWSSAARVCTSFLSLIGSGFFVARLGADLFLDERFGLPNRKAARDDVSREPTLIAFRGERHDRARVSHRERAGGHVAAHFLRQLQQAKVVRHRRAILADLRRRSRPASGETRRRAVDRPRRLPSDSDLRAGCFRSAPFRAGASFRPRARP